jgi:heterotetrameric sarcosine oxidase delta subunit
MLLIPCPWCGERAESEFTCGGEAHVERPTPAANTERWAHYLHFRANPHGATRERWWHARGCRGWFNVLRDTVTHEIRAVYAIGEKPPA